MIRQASESDIPALADLTVASWRAAYAGLMPREFLEGLKVEDRISSWRAKLEKPSLTTLVADQGGALAGYIDLLDRADCPGEAEIPALYVHPTAWRHGFGRRLMAAGLARAERLGLQRVNLWVLSGNARARRFYDAQRFSATGRERSSDRFGTFSVHEIEYARSAPFS